MKFSPKWFLFFIFSILAGPSRAAALNHCANIFAHIPESQLEELLRNQKFSELEMPTDGSGLRELWFIANLDSGDRKSITQTIDANNNVVSTKIETLSVTNEIYFYNLAGSFYEPVMEYVKFPSFGESIVYISGAAQVKMMEKHDISLAEALIYLKSLPKKISYTFFSPRGWESWSGKRFKFDYVVFAHNKKQRIRFVFEIDQHEPDVLILITAFFVNENYTD